jgi:alkanesulfonate monooxygenase
VLKLAWTAAGPFRGYDPYDDAIDYSRYLLPLVREEVARREGVSA